MQQVDVTTLRAIIHELQSSWLPARLENVYQCDRYTLKLALRTLQHRGWLLLSWHPQAARLHMSEPPPKGTDTFTFSQQLRHQLGGLALTSIQQTTPWERVVELQFARRPQEDPQWRLWVEVMGKYSNVILTTADRTIVTAAHQVSQSQSSVRPIQTGQIYEFPPKLLGPVPDLREPMVQWQERLTLVPGPIKTMLLKTYCGLSTALVLSLLAAADIPPDRLTTAISPAAWERLYGRWQDWLTALAQHRFTPGWRSPNGYGAHGYSVLGWDTVAPAPSVQTLIEAYYTAQLNQQVFQQLRHQLLQKLKQALHKLQTKAAVFQQQMQTAARADDYRQQADLLMAHLQDWQAGMTQITLPDFTTQHPVSIALDPERNGAQNAQALYKRHQKLKRSRDRVQPLLAEVEQEIQYLEQVEAAIEQVEQYSTPSDLQTLQEVRDELIQQQYLKDPDYRPPVQPALDFYRYTTPSGWELLVGRNNRQNEQLTFRVAGDYDLWFHTQEIPGSHALLRLDAGQKPDPADLQFAANVAAYHSRARQSHQVPVVYTQPNQVFKPKGAQPGMVIYRHETVIWGSPQAVAPNLYPIND